VVMPPRRRGTTAGLIGALTPLALAAGPIGDAS
jgi:hypothetical protein